MTYDAPETRMLAEEGWASALVQIDHGPGHRTHRVFTACIRVLLYSHSLPSYSL